MKRLNLKYRILIPLMLAMVIFLVSFVVTLQSFHMDYISNNIMTSIQSLNELYSLQIKNDADMMAAALKSISLDHQIKIALSKKDRKQLLNYTKDLFKELNKDKRITHLYFTGPDRINILRVHKPDKYGDKIERITTINAEKTGKLSYGIELGPLGTFTLRVVMPWYDNKKLIGFVELGEEIGYITQKLHKLLKIDIYVLIEKKYLDRKNWKYGLKMLGREGNWDRFPSVVITDSNSKDIPTKLSSIFTKNNIKLDTKVHEFTDNQRNYCFRFFPVTDAGNKRVGTMVAVSDITDIKKHHNITILLVSAICILLVIILFIVFYRLLNKVEAQVEAANIELLRINKAIESTSDAIVLTDISGKVVYNNKAFSNLFGYTSEQLNQKGGISILHADKNISEEIFQSIVKGKPWKGEIQIKSGNDAILNILLRADYISDEKGNIIHFLLIYTDITENKLCEITIIESEEKFRTIASIANDAVIMMDDNGDISFWNSAAEKILGYTSDEVIGKELHKLIVPEKYYDAYKEGLIGFQKSGTGNVVGKTLELQALRKGGEEFPVELSLSSVKLKGRWHAVGIIRNITDRKRLEEELKKLSYLDGLTGAANRRHLDEVAEYEFKRMMRESRPLSMIMCDIDYFKAYNDTYGHQKGDDCLKKVANVLKIATKRPADLVARYGGEEFAILLPGTDAKDAGIVAERMRSKIEDLGIKHSGSEVRSVVTMSFGVSSIVPAADTNIADLFKTSDYALYKAKKDGRNKVVVYG